MAAGLGFKDFVTGEVLTAADVDGYLMQGVWVFASAAARDAAVTSPQEGNFAYLKDTNVTTYYTGSAWANLDTTGMTNPMTTTGDTIYSSSGSTPARLAIGTAGQVLKVNAGATAPEWGAASASSTFVGCSIRGSTSLTQSISNATTTVVNFDAEDFDTDGFHSNVTNNSRITIPAGKTGYYQINYLARFASNSTGYRAIYPYKNGAVFSPSIQSVVQTSSTSSHSNGFSAIVYLVATDYIEMAVEQNSGGSLNLLVDNTRFSIGFLGA